MKKILAFLLALSMVLGSIGAPVYANEKEGDFEVLSSGLIVDESLPKQDDDNEEVEIPSWNLKRAILLLNEVVTVKEIDANTEIVDNTPVTKRMMRRVAHLSPEQCGAHDLKEWQIKVNSAEGLEYAENITWLSLVYQNLNDFSPIKDNVKLKHLDIRDCSKDGKKIEDISFLSKLTELDFLNIKAARPKDLTPLKGLTKLTYLDMESTKIENVEFVKDLKELEYFNAQFSFVKDIKPFENHTKLKTLLLSAPANKYIHGKDLLTDISAVSTLKNLKELDIGNHNVKDISFLKGLENLEVFTASNNLIEDLEVLLSLPKLDKVWVQGNPAYPGFSSSEEDFREAKKIYNNLNKKNLTKDDIDTLEKLENESEGVKAFFKESTLATLKGYLETLKTEDSVENKAFENMGTTPGEPGTDPEVKEKKIIEVIPSGEFTVEKGTDPKTVLPKTVKVKLADAGVITKDEEAKIGTFRRNFKDGLEFGPISIAYKVVDENGKILSSKENPNLIKAVDKNEPGVEYAFNSVGDYFEYVTEDSTRFFNVEINSDKYEIDGVYSFKQEPCPIHKQGTIGEVVANDKKADRKEANKEPELFYVIHVKEKTKTENPKLGINNIGISRTNETITYKVVDSEGSIISAKDNPNLFYARNKGSFTMYDKNPIVDGDYYSFEAESETMEYELKLNSDEYEMIGTYEFHTDYNMTTFAGYIAEVYNSNTIPTTYKMPGANPKEEVFIVKVKAKGKEDPGQTPTPDPGEDPTPGHSEKIGFVDGKVVFRLVDEKGNQLKASEVANDIKIVLDEFKNLEVDGDLFSHKFSSMTEKYNPLTIKSEKYELVSQNGFEGNFSYIDYGAHLNKVYLNGEEVDVIKNDTSKLDAKYFTIVVKEKETSKPDPSEKLGFVDGKVVFRLVDEKGNQLKASEVANDIKIKLDEFKNLEVDGDLFSHTIELPNGEKYNPLTIESEKYELVSQNGFKGSNSMFTPKLQKVYLDGEEVDITNNDTSKLDKKYFTIVVKEKVTSGETPVEPKPEDPNTGFKYVTGSTPGIGKDERGHEFITFKVIDENGNQVSAKEYPTLLITSAEQIGQDPLKAKANEDNFTFNTGLMVDNKYTILINPSSEYEIDGEYKFSVKNDASAGWKDIITTVENSKAGDKSYYKVHEDELNENVFTIHVKTKEEGMRLNVNAQRFINFASLSSLPSNNSPTLEDALKELNVEWDLANVKDEVGKYEIEGTVILEDGIVNPQGLKAKAVLNVVEKSVELDKKELQDLVNKANALDLTNKTEESKKALEDALTKAEEALKEATTQEEIDSAKTALIKAIEGLKNKESKPQPKPEDPIIPTPTPKDPIEQKLIELRGVNRYKTAVEISKKNFDKADTVVIASGETFSDALAAVSLAATENGPLLLTEKNRIPEEVLIEIERLGAKNIIFAGGESTISKTVERSLSGKNVTRISGKDRYETAINITKKVQERHPEVKTLVLADGRNYPDALAIGSYAAKNNMGILLSNGKQLSREAIDIIKNVDKVIVAGGNTSVPESINEQINKMGKEVEVLSGIDRYETSVKIADKFFKNADKVVIASGEVYADALAGAVAGAKLNAPILLVKSNELPKEVKEQLKECNPKEIIVLGGESTIDKNIRKKLEELIN